MNEPKSNGLKVIFMLLVATAFVCLAMCGVTLRRTIAQFGHPAPAQNQNAGARPSRAMPGVTAQPEIADSLGPAFRASGNLMGVWAGSAITQQGACNLKFEMRSSPAGTFLGYSTLMCFPLTPPNVANPVAVVLQRSARSAIMTGTAANGAIAFHVEKVIGPTDECPMTSLSATPFGGTQIAVDWKNGTCPGGQMILTRASQ